jgi:hypothetical protein
VAARKARFFVYELLGPDGASAYIGKGSGRRLLTQQKVFGLTGHEIARFWREKDAYAFERFAIADRQPILNRHPGGNGSRATPIRHTKYKWERDMERIGTRAYAARFLIGYIGHLMDAAWNAKMHSVAYG